MSAATVVAVTVEPLMAQEARQILAVVAVVVILLVVAQAVLALLLYDT